MARIGQFRDGQAFLASAFLVSVMMTPDMYLGLLVTAASQGDGAQLFPTVETNMVRSHSQAPGPTASSLGDSL